MPNLNITYYSVKDFDLYLVNLSKFVVNTVMHRALHKKGEYGQNKNEWSFRECGVIDLSRIARSLNLSEKTSLYFRLLGSFFPKCGAQGLACIREFMLERGISLPENELAANFVAQGLSDSGLMCAEGLHEMLLQLFGAPTEASDPEMQLAKLWHEITEVKKLGTFISGEKRDELELRFSANLAEDATTPIITLEISEKGIPTLMQEVMDMKNALLAQNSPPQMTEEEKLAYKEEIASYLTTFAKPENPDPLTGLYTFIWLAL